MSEKITINTHIPLLTRCLVRLFGKRCKNNVLEMYEFRGRFYILGPSK
jgi:hypothetical protein